MLRPERMSKVSVTGSRGVMPTVIETVHRLNLVHLSDYDGSWEGFDNGNPIAGADEASEKLVTVRALESTLGIEADETEFGGLENDWERRLERTRTRVNELDDRRSEIREDLRQVDERIDRVAPFAALGVDLDLLSGYETVDVVVGEGSRAAVEAALEEAAEVRAYETFTGDGVIAIVAAPAEGSPEGIIDDALVGIEFTRHPVPETAEAPETYVAELEGEKRRLETSLEEIDAELEEIRREEGAFLLRLEEELTIDVQRAEAPLQFATTDRAFVAEGWIPAETYDEFVAALRDAVGESVEIEQLEVADYEEHEHGAEAHTGSGGDGEDEESEATAQPAQKAATDGGTKQTGGHGSGAVTMDDQPPVILNNITPAKPFELLVKMVSQPKYSELDPTLLVFLTYPFAFGFMIGDIGYGILYMLMGWGCWKLFDSDAGKALGTIGIWAGAFTILFGWLYDDIFGVHMEYFVPEGIHGPMQDYLFVASLDKGLQATEWAMLWIILSLIFGLIHLNIGLIMGFINELSHGVKTAVYERLSWILAMNGLFIWFFAHEDAGSFDHGIGFLPDDLAFSETKPDFLVGTTDEAVLNSFLGFVGLPEIVGVIGLAAFIVGAVMVGVGEGIAGVFEVPAWAFGHVLSYLRMVAVLLAKGGMAFAVNLLVFGAYEYTEDGYTSFALFEAPSSVAEGDGGTEVAFEGLVWIGLNADFIGVTILALIGAVLVFVFGHILVLLLGITAAGIQMLRLEYVEFFQKFYEGGGEEYEPFGHGRNADADRSAQPQAD
ncbi:V-type ATP synthase subunit I [Natrononativus amylolyticus]|uniref:V-type ATP synthase subunit I n=1 Tax=Natrononativus amylolyticus TaxID=2963434 RepID=UPI0020CDD672|nr:V-type ATP synthase subunit I [Natrononativus amylolyticus]